MTALRGAGIPSLLIKGPVLRHRLYSDGACRPYVDSDLLVEARTFEAAERLLMGRGFVRGWSDKESERPAWAQHDHRLVRPGEDICVELHWRLMHYDVAPERVWEGFNRGSTKLTVGSVEVDVPADPQLALHAVIHVAEHGAMPRPAEDLRRALEQIPLETWQAARDLARELNAEAAFAAGLDMLESGRAMAGRLGLQAGGVAAFSLERVAHASGWLEKARLALRIAFPQPTYMRSFGSRLARSGRAGLVAAYAWRPIELLARTPGALLARSRAQRHVG